MARIALHNLTGVDTEALGVIAESADLPQGSICLIIGDPLLGQDFQGCTIARGFVPWAGNIFGLENHLDEDWECGVVIGRKWAERQADFLAYFAYLLGHEFGHAATVLSRLWLAVYEDIILRYVPRIVTEKRWRWDEFPHEARYDQFGLAVAEEAYGRTAVERDIREILAAGLSDDTHRLTRVLTLEPSRNLEPLPGELAEFSRPFREKLLELWRTDTYQAPEVKRAHVSYDVGFRRR